MKRYIVMYRRCIAREEVTNDMHHHHYLRLHPCGPGFHAMGGPGRGRRSRHFGPPGGGFDAPRGPRARRGDVRTALLVLLAEEPRNGYQLMQAIEERSEGAWRPSPGSVYPTLEQLEDEGLVTTTERDGRRVFELTDAGREHVAERPEDAPAPWEAAIGPSGHGGRELMKLVRDVATAAAQVLHAGDRQQVEQAREVLDDARRSLYRILAGDPPDEMRD
jgi:DNA-binding PadR family transcriptional regulator